VVSVRREGAGGILRLPEEGDGDAYEVIAVMAAQLVSHTTVGVAETF